VLRLSAESRECVGEVTVNRELLRVLIFICIIIMIIWKFKLDEIIDILKQ
jgi:hypothetical protein